jgi:hypothetical protein
MPSEIEELMNAKLERLRASRLEAMKEVPGDELVLCPEWLAPFGRRGEMVPTSLVNRMDWLLCPVFRKNHDERHCTTQHPCKDCREWAAEHPEYGLPPIWRSPGGRR